MRIAVNGAGGRLGKLIVAQAGAAFAGAVQRGGAVPECDVVIDVSSATGTPRPHTEASRACPSRRSPAGSASGHAQAA